MEAIRTLASRVFAFYRQGFEVGIVLGGGNLFRGISSEIGIERCRADQMGMLATLINGIALQEAIKELDVDARLISALDCPKVAEDFQFEKVIRYLNEGKILIFAGGTGHPYFTTDTCAALRASEIHADIFLKCTTHVDGIYSKDPRKFPDAIKYEKISYTQVLQEKLGILDLTAVAMCMERKIPICVYNLYQGSFFEAIEGKFGSIVTEAI